MFRACIRSCFLSDLNVYSHVLENKVVAIFFFIRSWICKVCILYFSNWTTCCKTASVISFSFMDLYRAWLSAQGIKAPDKKNRCSVYDSRSIHLYSVFIKWFCHFTNKPPPQKRLLNFCVSVPQFFKCGNTCILSLL